MAKLILYDIWIILQLVIGYNLLLPLVLYTIYLIKRKPQYISKLTTETEADYAIIVTAYEQTNLLKVVTDSILQLNYNNYLVYVVADNCDISQLHFADERIILLRPEDTLRSNTRSHFYAITHFKRAHTRLTIVDSDNLTHPEYLNELNKYFDAGFIAIQGTRKAKNLNTTYACLDAVRDMYYHFYDGEVIFSIGSSATLAGSGMSFTTALYRECLETLDIKGAGFDKVLQKEIVSRGYRIAFAKQAVVYDEKTAGSDQLVKQRARWINTWFRYFKFGFLLLGIGITKFDWNRFLFGIILLRPPLFIFLLLSVVFTIVNFLISTAVVLIWLTGFACFILGFTIALVHAKPDKVIYKSLLGIPKFVFFQILSLIKSKKANQLSVATKHIDVQDINEVKKRG